MLVIFLYNSCRKALKASLSREKTFFFLVNTIYFSEKASYEMKISTQQVIIREKAMIAEESNPSNILNLDIWFLLKRYHLKYHHYNTVKFAATKRRMKVSTYLTLTTELIYFCPLFKTKHFTYLLKDSMKRFYEKILNLLPKQIIF